jgi:hypothetical protein
MTTHIDFRTLPANVPVLCIPRVYPNINESRIRKIFDDLNMGSLDHIDIVSKHSGKGENFNRVYIHFRRWNESENACIAREKLLNGKEIKIIYDDPWFWKISAYRETERKPSAPIQRKATIQFDSDEEIRANRDKNPRPVSYRNEKQRPHDQRRSKPDEQRRSKPDDQIIEHKEVKPLQDKSEDQGIKIDYGELHIPNRKPLKKVTLKIEEEGEEVEVQVK